MTESERRSCPGCGQLVGNVGALIQHLWIQHCVGYGSCFCGAEFRKSQHLFQHFRDLITRDELAFHFTMCLVGGDDCLPKPGTDPRVETQI